MKLKQPIVLGRKPVSKPAAPFFVARPLRQAVKRVKVTMAVNAKGNRRGMNNVENPPSSEHMRKIRAMRKIYNKQMPELQCSGCAFSAQCPQYRAGYKCAFTAFFNSHQIDSPEDLMVSMKELLAANMRRVHQASMMETLTGTMPSAEVSEAYNMLFMQLKSLYDKMAPSAEIEMTSEDGTIIGRLFGDLGNLVQTTHEDASNVLKAPLAQNLSGPRPDKMLELPPALDTIAAEQSTG